MRIIKNGEGYELIQLDQKLRNRVLTNLRKRNLTIMKQCVKDIRVIFGKDVLKLCDPSAIQIACALFEKLATKSFTELSQAETRVVHEIKEAGKMQRKAAEAEIDKEIAAEKHPGEEFD